MTVFDFTMQKLPPVAVLVGYLVMVGILAAIAGAVLLLLFIGYLLQLLLASIYDVCLLFNSLPPVVRLLFVLLSLCTVMWCLSSHLRRMQRHGTASC